MSDSQKAAENLAKAADYRTFLEIFRPAKVDKSVDNLCKSLLMVGRLALRGKMGNLVAGSLPDRAAKVRLRGQNDQCCGRQDAGGEKW